jgi:CheY-like chemotaxis protein
MSSLRRESGGPVAMPKQLLIIDDRPDDAEVLERFLRKKGISNPIRVLPDGLTAINYLHGLEPYSNRQLHPFPALIFLEINLPRGSSYEVLEWLQAHLEIPTPGLLVFTHAIGLADLQKCSLLGVTTCLLKQTLQEQFRDLLIQFADVWEFADPSPIQSPAPALTP